MLLREYYSNASEGSWGSMKHTILLIHGLGTNSKVWSEYTSFFSSYGFNVIAPSLRYHDREDSCKELGVVSLLDYIEDLKVIRFIVNKLANENIFGYTNKIVSILKQNPNIPSFQKFKIGKNIISNNNQTNKKINDLEKEILDNSIKEIKKLL